MVKFIPKMADDGLREIQLNGKQLVFLFMAATVAAVVIFLCGVMVGRGVRPHSEIASLSVEAATDPTARAQSVPPSVDPPPATAAPSSGSAASQEQLTYPERLSEPASPPETFSEPSPAPAGTRRAEPAGEPSASETRTGAAASNVPAGDGFTVQVAAVKERGEAEIIAQRLAKKGYPAYVMPPAPGAPRVFRVRVGKFKERREAESVAARLEKQEQFRPWITR